MIGTGGAGAPFEHVIADLAGLRSLYGDPHPLTARKKIDHVDAGVAAIVAASPLVFLATADHQGTCTVSPKGGPPGFVKVLDEKRLAIPDYVGNELLDGLRNLIANPHVGLLFVLPGRDATVRVTGAAWITTDPAVLGRLDPDADFEDRRPLSAIGVLVETAFVHCGASFTRARAWKPETWGEVEAPSLGKVSRGHLAITDPAAGA